MKKTYLLSLFIIMLYCSCNKAFQNTTPGTLNYTLIHPNISLDANSTYHLNPQLYISGDIKKNPITISFKGLPANVTVSPSSVTVDTNYSPVFVFSGNNAATGVYNLQMIVSNSQTGDESYSFKLTVLPANDCASGISSSFSHYVYGCNSGSYSVILSAIPGTPNMFTISNFENIGSSYSVSAIIDCGSNGGSNNIAIYLPRQTINGYTISGSGYYYNSVNTNTVYITDTVINPVGVKTICQNVQIN